MKLYYTPGACSLSPHIALKESGLPHELVKVDLRAKKLATGEDFNPINPKSQVPALVLDSGELITEGPVIVQIIADKVADKKLAPANGTPERYRLQEWLNFVGAEVHKTFGPLFNPLLSDDAKKVFRDRVVGKFAYIDSKLAGQDYLMGPQFTVADGYLYTMLRWADGQKVDLSSFKNLMTYKERVAARPAVQAALQAEAAAAAA